MSLDAFCRRVLTEPSLQQGLLASDDPQLFAHAVADIAQTRGFEVAAESVMQVLQSPLPWFGTETKPVIADAPQGEGWLPIAAGWIGGRLYLQWSHFGGEKLRGPRFEDDIRRSLTRPFNYLFSRYATPIESLEMQAQQGLRPNGFIFHMSRCGSTWLARMLAALDRTVVLSEADPIDVVVQAHHVRPNLEPEEQARWLRWIVRALAAPRAGEIRSFIKLDSWHARALPLFRRAFPETPRLFLYRDPVEVLMSHQARPGAQMFPELAGPRVRFFGADGPLTPEEHYARVLADMCEAALANCSGDEGLFINYRQLPDALWTEILLHFGVEASETERAAMMEAGRYNAKAPDILFAGDSEAKRRSATPEIRAAAEKWLAPLYAALEARRTERRSR